VQGIVSEEHAERIALDVLSGWNDNDDATVHITVAKVWEEAQSDT
jgi:hypothetical protein